MTFRRASQLRDLIKAETGWRCIVPANRRTRDHGAEIMTVGGPKEFRSERAFRAYLKASRIAAAAIEKFAKDHGIAVQDTRSPIARMIDDACGRKP